MAIKRRTKVESTFSMSSMTDIVFLLLIFFLVTSTLVNPNALKLLLPKSSNQVAAKPQVSISIKQSTRDNNYSFHINGSERAVPFGRIEGELRTLLIDREDPTFSIYADRTVAIEQVVNLMNIAKRNQYKVILATYPE